LRAIIDHLQAFNPASALFRMILGMAMGGTIGLNREYKRRAAGFRTYMLVCLGAVTTMLLSQYEYYQLLEIFPEAENGAFTDVSRFGAQVINGIGFLGAGTVIVTDRQRVRGLTTAAGLWACACLGLAIGAGFYACMAVGFFYVLLAIRFFPAIERRLNIRLRNLNLFIELHSAAEIGQTLIFLREKKVEIYDVELQKSRQADRVGVVLTLRLPRGARLVELLAGLSAVPGVLVAEVI